MFSYISLYDRLNIHNCSDRLSTSMIPAHVHSELFSLSLTGNKVNEYQVWNNQSLHAQMPLSNRMKPVIFPPLMLNVSAKWEVKSQIWDVTFSLAPCLLLLSFPFYPPISVSPAPLPPGFVLQFFYLIASSSSLCTQTAPIWMMLAYLRVELMDFIQNKKSLIRME